MIENPHFVYMKSVFLSIYSKIDCVGATHPMLLEELQGKEVYDGCLWLRF